MEEKILCKENFSGQFELDQARVKVISSLQPGRALYCNAR
jgi:hypothetical protein